MQPNDIDAAALKKIFKSLSSFEAVYATEEPLIRVMLEHRNKKHRYTAAFSLGKIGSPTALSSLLQVVNNSDEDNAVVAAACTALGNLGDISAIPPLTNLVRSQAFGSGNTSLLISDNLYTVAVKSIFKISNTEAGPVLLDLLDICHEDTQAAICKCLAKCKYVEALPAIDKLFNDLKHSDADESNLRDIEKAIKALSKLTVP